MLTYPVVEEEKWERFLSMLQIKAGFVVDRHCSVIPLLLCPMKPCVSKYRTCMSSHYAKRLDAARVIVLVGKDAYKVYFDSGAISEMLYGSSFKEAGKQYFCFSDYRNLSDKDPRSMDWAPSNILYWEDRIQKEAKAFGKFIRETLREGA